MGELGFTLMLLAVGQGAVLSVVLARRRQNRLANHILAALIGALALMLLLGYFDLRWGWDGHPHLIALGSPLPYLFAPLQWLYVVALTRPLSRLHPRQLVHALPFVANVIFMMQGFFFLGAEEKLAVAKAVMAGGGGTSVLIMDGLQVVQAIAYLVASFVALRHYKHRIEGFFSDLQRIDLRWLTVLIGAHASVWCLVLVHFALKVLQVDTSGMDFIRPAIQMGSALFIFLVGYISLWQPELFQKATDAQCIDEEDSDAPPEPLPGPAKTLERTTPETTPEATKYQRNRLEADEAADLVAGLERLMTEDELYRDSSLTAQVLADGLGVTPHLLSQVLNVHIGKSFYAFVNQHRAEALKGALADPNQRDQKVLDLALAVGFNSKSTVNSVFKKHTGLTPTQFRAKVVDEEAV